MQELDLPSVLSNDIIVIISVILTESNHYPSHVQVVVTQTEEREELSLQDFNEIFLTVILCNTEHYHQLQRENC